MRCLLSLALFGLLSVSGKKKTAKIGVDDECVYALEVVLLQDGSDSFQTHIDQMAELMTSLTQTLKQEYGDFKFGVASFVDKPLPLRGYGNFGAWNTVPDYCYRQHAPLTEENDDIISGLRELRANMGSGNDMPENPFEGLMLTAADSAMGWSAPDVTHTADGRPIIRLIIEITDDVPHEPGDAIGATAYNWNYPRTYLDDPTSCAWGGFGCHNYAGYSGTVNVRSEENQRLYDEMCDLFAAVDHDKLLSEKETERLDELIAKFGPYFFPEPYDPHPGDVSLQCEEVEYPSAEQTGAFLKKFNIVPVFLLAEPSDTSQEHEDACWAIGMNPGTPCLVEVYKRFSDRMGMDNVVDSIDGTNTEERIVQAIREMTNLACIRDQETTTGEIVTTKPTTTSTTETTTETTAEITTRKTHIQTTVESTTTTETTTTEETTSTTESTTSTESTTETTTYEPSTEESTKKHVPTTNTDWRQGTTEPLTSESSTEESTKKHVQKTSSSWSEGTKAPTDDDSTTSTETSTETSTTEEPLIPVVPPGGGSEGSGGSGGSEGPSVGVIAGASAGAVAALAAGGAAFAKFGGGFMGGGGAQGLEAIQQVETPDSPIERETMEQVTMEMFQ